MTRQDHAGDVPTEEPGCFAGALLILLGLAGLIAIGWAVIAAPGWPGKTSGILIGLGLWAPLAGMIAHENAHRFPWVLTILYMLILIGGGIAIPVFLGPSPAPEPAPAAPATVTTTATTTVTRTTTVTTTPEEEDDDQMTSSTGAHRGEADRRRRSFVDVDGGWRASAEPAATETREPAGTGTAGGSGTAGTAAAGGSGASGGSGAPGTGAGAAAPPATESSGYRYFPNCAAAWDAGAAPMDEGDPGYRPGLDRDGDGRACEPKP